jgi:hypothetical protein
MMAPLLRVVQRAFVVDHRARRIGEGPLRARGARITDVIELVGETLIQANQRAIAKSAVGIQFFGARRIQIGRVALESHQPRPVLHDDGVIVFGKRIIEQIGQAQPPIPFAP